MSETAHYSAGEEIANSVTHGIGALAGVAGLAILVRAASRYGGVREIAASAVFGVTIIVLFTTSTLYHALPSRRAKNILQILDHSAIFLLIAGTYTPFALVTLRGAWGWSLLGVVWGIAILGISFQGTFLRRAPKLEIGLYLALGWAVVVAARPLIAALAPGGLELLAAGGLAYTAGVVFYVSRRLPYNHAAWHLFVMAGATCHFFAVLLYVIPQSSRPL